MNDLPSTPTDVRHRDYTNVVDPSIDYTPTTIPSPASSPRTSVANRLSDLSLRKTSLESAALTPQPSPSRKRIHSPVAEQDAREEGLQRFSFSSNMLAVGGLGSHARADNGEFEPKERDLQSRLQSTEDPAHQLRQTASSSTRDIENIAPLRQKLAPKPKLKRRISPPPPPPADDAQLPDEDDFTWQDHEITGHLMQDADDDGYGINGIGFRPTAATAYARSQRRKQQIDEWKARESKDARRMRSERRRKADDEGSRPPSFTGGTSNESESAVSDNSSKRRSVRFV